MLVAPLDPADTSVVRFDADLAMPLEGRDTFFVVRVEPGPRVDPALAGTGPSFTNPVLVDADGDGAWSP